MIGELCGAFVSPQEPGVATGFHTMDQKVRVTLLPSDLGDSTILIGPVATGCHRFGWTKTLLKGNRMVNNQPNNELIISLLCCFTD